MHCSPPPLLPPAVEGREADGYGRMNEALEGTMAPGDEAGPGVMSPGRRRWGFSGCDGSTLKNTSASFPPACALVSPSFRPTIFHFLCFTSCQRISLHSALFTSSSSVFSAYISLLTHFSLSVICWQRQKIVWFCHKQNIYCHIAFMSFPEVDMFKQNSVFGSCFCQPFSFCPSSFPFPLLLCLQLSLWKSAIILYPSVTFSSTLTFRNEKGSLQASSALLSIVLTLECLGHDWLLWVSLQPLLRSCLLWLGIHLWKWYKSLRLYQTYQTERESTDHTRRERSRNISVL